MGVSVPISGVRREIADLKPVGVILAFGGTAAPSGWLLCDGSAVSRTSYNELFNVIGSAFGQGDGSTTFNLPDLRGRFLRGVDGKAARDPDRDARSAMAAGGNDGNAIASVQADEFDGHTHTGPSHTHTTGVPSGSGSTFSNLYAVLGGDTSYVNKTSSTAGTGATSATGGSETRPANANVNYLIKYR
jgi:microcystin-dependent protein